MNPQMTPDEAKAALGHSNMLVDHLLMANASQDAQNAPQQEENTSMGKDMNMEKSMSEMENKMDKKMETLRTELKETIKTEVESIRNTIKEALDQETNEQS